MPEPNRLLHTMMTPFLRHRVGQAVVADAGMDDAPGPAVTKASSPIRFMLA